MKLTEKQIAEFDEASNHPHNCDCGLCQQWWALVGPEDEGEPECECDDLSFDTLTGRAICHVCNKVHYLLHKAAR